VDTLSMATIESHNPRTGLVAGYVAETPLADVDAAALRAAAAAPSVADASPATRSSWLRAVADALEAHQEELVAVADAETALGASRLESEVARTAAQLRHYADVAAEGSWLGATVDRPSGADTPELRRLNVPVGPVAVLGSSNFPLAFGIVGNDTGSAIAAGCPVIAKAHPAHPQLDVLLTEIAISALDEGGAPSGTLGVVHGFSAGQQLVMHPSTAAVAFTGSQAGGFALCRLAASRNVIIPVFAEMGSLNPLVVTPAAAAARTEEIARGFVDSLTLGMGQYCTKPGLLLVPSGHGLVAAVTSAFEAAAPAGWLLTQPIATSYAVGVGRLLEGGGRLLAAIPAVQGGWAASPTLVAATPDQIVYDVAFSEEYFGPVAVVCEYGSEQELERVLAALPGSLVAAVHGELADDPLLAALTRRLAHLAGRVVVNGYPTGVVVGWAQQHGGPWPATTAPAATSVGAGALARFVRPVAYQNAPADVLPPPIRDDNPWRVPQRIDGKVRRTGTRTRSAQ
jgi:NADP-dependent aldehyde dehydrogenase